MKLAVGIRSWPFKSLKNSLQFIFVTETVSVNNDNDDYPGCLELESANSNGNLNWFSLNIGGIVMYLSFFPSFFFITWLKLHRFDI